MKGAPPFEIFKTPRFSVPVILFLFLSGWILPTPIDAFSTESKITPYGTQGAIKPDIKKPGKRVLVYNRPSSPAAGVFLVAESRLQDPNFSRTVVLILKHGAQGSLGIIINRPTSRPLTKIWKDLKGVKEKDDRLFIGGPVYHETFGMLYLGDKKKNNHPPIFGNVFFSNNSEYLAPIVEGTAGGASAFRVYAGYAGWAPGQLQNELSRGDWRLVDGFPEAIFRDDPETLWSELLAESEQEWILLPPPDGSDFQLVGLLTH